VQQFSGKTNVDTYNDINIITKQY